jgi:hypothetical protein
MMENITQLRQQQQASKHTSTQNSKSAPFSDRGTQCVVRHYAQDYQVIRQMFVGSESWSTSPPTDASAAAGAVAAAGTGTGTSTCDAHQSILSRREHLPV